MKKVLITGSDGFIGKNLKTYLSNFKEIELVSFTKQNSLDELSSALPSIDFIYHLAGVNRPQKIEEFYNGNTKFTEKLIELIESKGMKIPILYTSSIYAESDNDYGKSKKQAEEALLRYGKKNNIPVYIYRLPNVFGKWCLPNYNSVVSTFCYNISHDIGIKINNPTNLLNLVYIDDVVKAFTKHLSEENQVESNYYKVEPNYNITVGELAEMINSFRNAKDSIIIPNLSDRLNKLLHATYLSYLEGKDLAHTLEEKEDFRGSFVEIFKSLQGGQISVSYSKPGVIRGNHYHDTKNEKFIVIKGRAKVKLRNVFEEQIIEYQITEEKLEAINIPPGYTHNIENIGNDEMILLIWANECFDPNNQDTYYCEVEK